MPEQMTICCSLGEVNSSFLFICFSMKSKMYTGRLSFRCRDAVDSVWFKFQLVKFLPLHFLKFSIFIMVYSLLPSVLQFVLCCGGLTLPFWCAHLHVQLAHKQISTYIIISQGTYFSSHAMEFSFQHKSLMGFFQQHELGICR